MAAIWCFLLLEWWRTASATVHSQRVGSLEIRHLERVDLHELPDSGVVWAKEVQELRGEKRATQQLSLRPKCNLGADGHSRNQTARHRSLSNYNKWRNNCNLYVETIKHKQVKAWTCLLSNLLGPGRSYGKSSRWRVLSAVWTWMLRRWKLRGNC